MQLGTPRAAPGHWDPSRGLSCSSEPPPTSPMPPPLPSQPGTNTGDGYQCKPGAKYPQRTIFDNLLAAGHEYARIYNDSIVDLYVDSFNSAEAKARTQTMDRFFDDAAKGTLPALTWISPRQGVNKTLGTLGGPNSDHPNCCDVALGERLRKDIYEAVWLANPNPNPNPNPGPSPKDIYEAVRAGPSLG